MLFRQREIEIQQAISLARMAEQTAHDIRSPIAALNTVVSCLQNIPEDQRLMLRSAVNRIKDIANGLIEKNKSLKAGIAKEAEVEKTEDSSVQLLSAILEPLISREKNAV